jgi:hypothetical protein
MKGIENDVSQSVSQSVMHHGRWNLGDFSFGMMD